MEVTEALVRSAKAAQFDFGEDTAIVAVQHMLWQTVDLFRGMADLGVRTGNIFALGKIYSNSFEVIRTLRGMGVTVTDSATPQPGEFGEYFERDIRHLWEVADRVLAQRYIKRIIVLDDGGKCITNTPPGLLRRYSIGGVEQTSHGMFLFEQRPPPFAVTSWARTAVKLQIGGAMFSHCLIDKVNTEFLKGKPLRGQELGIIGLGSIGAAMAKLALRQDNKILFFDPSQDLRIPQYLQDRITRVDSLEELMASCDYVFGCSGRNPFADKWPMKYLPGIKLFSGSGGDQEFGPVIRDLNQKPGFKVAPTTWDITSDDGPCGPMFIAYQGYPYNFISRDGEGVPSRIVQLETGGLLAGLIQARSYLALSENGDEENTGIHRVSPEAQRFVYETWLGAMRNQNIDVSERYGYDPALLKATNHNKWFVENTEPNPCAGYEPKNSIEDVMTHIIGGGGSSNQFHNVSTSWR
jgi:hypothetical protein